SSCRFSFVPFVSCGLYQPSLLQYWCMPVIYDRRYCPKRLFCLPIVQNTRELPLTELWDDLTCVAALHRTAPLTRPTIPPRRHLPPPKPPRRLELLADIELISHSARSSRSSFFR